ncbi:MAG: Lipoyltransferase [Pseudomonadota bacterium]|jgi:lipoyl(octanoyl) transferase|nr:lipoyl(octanoyl) transferase LipB [Betaproteobacteria bacterium]NBT83702.1 lipoyl(octanoyl) transferase LipB [Betaproteobacteria bacterium]
MIECKTLRPADYLEILQRMRQFSESRGAATPDALWQVEHSPVFTLGQAGQERHILDAGDIPIVRTERGGQVTYHGPGQVVVYTLIDIRRRGLFVKDFVCRLEQALIDTLSDYGITQAQRKSNAPGVYVAYQGELAKIAALGLKVSRGKTYHGVALNLQMNLEPFSRINPCGYPGLRTVDMATMGRAQDWQQVADRLCHRVNEQLTK